MLNEQGYVAECTGDNLFLVHEGMLATPPIADGALDGITRRVIMELAAGMGIDSIFVTAGIHRFDLGVADGECPDADAVARVAEEYGVTPTFTMPSFVW